MIAKRSFFLKETYFIFYCYVQHTKKQMKSNVLLFKLVMLQNFITSILVQNHCYLAFIMNNMI